MCLASQKTIAKKVSCLRKQYVACSRFYSKNKPYFFKKYPSTRQKPVSQARKTGFDDDF
jgi:hypothetical protein